MTQENGNTGGKKELGRGGGRGQGARRSIAGCGSEKDNRASLRKEAGQRPPGEIPMARPNAPREVNLAVGKEKRPGHAASASLASPVSPANLSHFY